MKKQWSTPMVEELKSDMTKAGTGPIYDSGTTTAGS
jgi:hypothetical protein